MEGLDQLSNVMTNLAWALVFLAIGVLALFAFGYALLLWIRNRNREEYSLSFVTLEVVLPRDNEIKIDAAEQLFASLYSVKNEEWYSFLQSEHAISFEIVGRKEDIKFYVSVPHELMELVEKQVHGAYPGAEIKSVEEFSIFEENGKVAFESLIKSQAGFYPIQSFRDLATDPLSSITSFFAKMRDGEGAMLQVVVSPASHAWSSKGHGYISRAKKDESNPEKASYSVDPKSLEAIERSAGKPGFEVSIRLVVNAPTKQEAHTLLKQFSGTFAQFAGPYNKFVKQYIFLKRLFMVDFIYRYPAMFRGKSILNSEELATIFHFPNKQIETPHIHWLTAKTAPAPSQIPNTGLYLGKSVYRGMSRKIYISDKDRARHMYIIGKTGTGKSELLMDMILQDIRAGKGVCFIDPHDSVEKLLEYIPPERAEDVIYFNPADTDRPMGLNMLEARTEEEKQFVASSIINLMYKLYDPHKTGIIGPRFEHAIRNAMMTVMVEPGATFIEIVRIMTDPKFLQELLPKVEDPMVRRYWTDQIAQTSDFHKSEVLDYIVSKFGRFITDKMMRNIIGQSYSAFNFREVMDKGKILLINLAKGRIGEENSAFLGLILVPKILVAAMSRQDIPESERRDFNLYVDEFQNFATPDFATILSEARKYHLNLIVANQFIGQIEEEVKNAVFGNVGTLLSFRVGVQDANFLQHEFSPTFSEADLTNVERYHTFVKTIVDNEPMPPFSMDLTRDVEAERKLANPKLAEMIKKLSRLKYGKDKNILEVEIAKRARL
ncbi:MAG: type IV secretion system DNA-binding domain-containing protein [Microgenomates group bacterium]